MAHQRRSSAEVHDLILRSATRLFAERGVVATRTRDIADDAGVAEPLVFRHFGSKEALIRAAVFHPIEDFFTTFVTAWREGLGAGRETSAWADYVRGLHEVLVRSKHLLLALLASDDHRTTVTGRQLPDERSVLAHLLTEVEELATDEQRADLRDDLDKRLATRFTFAVALSMALFGDMMLRPGEVRPTDEEVADAMLRYLVRAMRRDPAPPAAGGRG